MPDYMGGGGGQYESARRGVENQYTQQASQNAYGRFLGLQRGQRGLSDMTRGFKQNYAPMAAQYGARGLAGPGVQSGVRERGVGDYVGNYYRDFGRGQQDLANQLQGFDMNQGLLDSWRQEALSNIDLERYRNIAGSASNLQALRDWLGGI